MKPMASISACLALVCLIVVPASAGDKKPGEQMTVEQMRAQTLRARATQRGVVIRMKGGGKVSGEVQEVTAQGFSLKNDKGLRVWVEYSDVQTIKPASTFKYAMINILAAVGGAVIVGALLGLAAWVAILIVNA